MFKVLINSFNAHAQQQSMATANSNGYSYIIDWIGRLKLEKWKSRLMKMNYSWAQ